MEHQPNDSLPERNGAANGSPRPRTVLVLGGSGVRGFAHAGVFSALEQLGLPVDEIVACGLGAVVGGAVAAGLDTSRRAALFGEIAAGGCFRLEPPGASIPRTERYSELLRHYFGDRELEGLPTPLVCNTLSLTTGRSLALGMSPRPGLRLADAVYAASAMPGVFEPLELGGERYVDGGVTDPLPIALAQARRPELILAVDLSGVDYDRRAEVGPAPADVLYRSQEIASSVLAESLLHRAGNRDDVVVIKPDLADVGLVGQVDVDDLMRRGESAAYRTLTTHPVTRYLCTPLAVRESDRDRDQLRDFVYLDVDPNACTHCGICAVTCATEGYAAVASGNVVRKLHHYECTRDGACVRRCPTRAIRLVVS